MYGSLSGCAAECAQCCEWQVFTSVLVGHMHAVHCACTAPCSVVDAAAIPRRLAAVLAAVYLVTSLVWGGAVCIAMALLLSSTGLQGFQATLWVLP